MTKKIIVFPEESKIYGEILNLASNPISRKKIQNELNNFNSYTDQYSIVLMLCFLYSKFFLYIFLTLYNNAS